MMSSANRDAGAFLFKLLTFAYLFILLALVLAPQIDSGATSGGKTHTGLVDVKGVIADDEAASADMVVTGLRRAFENEKYAGGHFAYQQSRWQPSAVWLCLR